ncbi:unnamed protein product [Ectocarpus sp. CCAP 1310/34]|nr:unnamed protein product [Ectocarpus sp. CCAP 1310/34]
MLPYGPTTMKFQVTSPPDFPGESPYIPEGFKTDNTLPLREANGAAWKECYDGNRCDAWWGGLEGSPDGEPVVLDAPLDWPDCCALCNGGGDNDGDGSGTNSTCVAWSFDPSTGWCQRMPTVEETSYDYSWTTWQNSNTINGLMCMHCLGFCARSTRAGLLRELAVEQQQSSPIEQPQSSRLVKAACVKVRVHETAPV